MKLTGLMNLLASFYFFLKTLLSAAPYSMAPSALTDGSWNVTFLLLFIRWKKGCSLMASLSRFHLMLGQVA